MKCVICKTGEVKPGTTSFSVERGEMTLVLKRVPCVREESLGGPVGVTR